jgi:outer membrane protein W
MKNKLIFVFLLITGTVSAQSFNNKLLISTDLMYSGVLGSHITTSNNASFIKLFPNMRLAIGSKIGLTYLVGDNIGISAIYKYDLLEKWKYGCSEEFLSSEARFQFFSPSLYFQTGDINNGKFRLFSQAGPMLSIVKAELQDPVIFVDDPSGTTLVRLKTANNINPGFNLSIGIAYSINDLTNLSLEVDYAYFSTHSVLYPDKGVNLLTLEAGVIFKILKGKRYYY